MGGKVCGLTANKNGFGARPKKAIGPCSKNSILGMFVVISSGLSPLSERVFLLRKIHSFAVGCNEHEVEHTFNTPAGHCVSLHCSAPAQSLQFGLAFFSNDAPPEDYMQPWQHHGHVMPESGKWYGRRYDSVHWCQKSKIWPYSDCITEANGRPKTDRWCVPQQSNGKTS